MPRTRIPATPAMPHQLHAVGHRQWLGARKAAWAAAVTNRRASQGLPARSSAAGDDDDRNLVKQKSGGNGRCSPFEGAAKGRANGRALRASTKMEEQDHSKTGAGGGAADKWKGIFPRHFVKLIDSGHSKVAITENRRGGTVSTKEQLVGRARLRTQQTVSQHPRSSDVDGSGKQMQEPPEDEWIHGRAPHESADSDNDDEVELVDGEVDALYISPGGQGHDRYPSPQTAGMLRPRPDDTDNDDNTDDNSGGGNEVESASTHVPAAAQVPTRMPALSSPATAPALAHTPTQAVVLGPTSSAGNRGAQPDTTPRVRRSKQQISDGVTLEQARLLRKPHSIKGCTKAKANDGAEASDMVAKSAWCRTTDQVTGRDYWWHRVTREVQWVQKNSRLPPRRRRKHACTPNCHHVCATPGCNEMLTADAARSRCVRCARCRKLGGVAAEKATPAALAKVVAQRAAVVTAAAAVKAAKAAEAAERAGTENDMVDDVLFESNINSPTDGKQPAVMAQHSKKMGRPKRIKRRGRPYAVVSAAERMKRKRGTAKLETITPSQRKNMRTTNGAATATTFAIYEHQQRQAAAINAKVSQTAPLVKPNFVNTGGKTTLMFAAENANIDKVKELVTKGDTDNACSTNGKTASEKGHADASMLLQQAAAQGTAATTAGTLATVLPKSKKRVAPTLIAASPLSAVSTAPVAATASALYQHQQQQALCINSMVLQAASVGEGHGHNIVAGGGLGTNGGGEKKRAATSEPEHLEGMAKQKKARTSTTTAIPAARTTVLPGRASAPSSPTSSPICLPLLASVSDVSGSSNGVNRAPQGDGSTGESIDRASMLTSVDEKDEERAGGERGSNEVINQRVPLVRGDGLVATQQKQGLAEPQPQEALTTKQQQQQHEDPRALPEQQQQNTQQQQQPQQQPQQPPGGQQGAAHSAAIAGAGASAVVAKSVWGRTTDQVTGRDYWWHRVTKEVQWVQDPHENRPSEVPFVFFPATANDGSDASTVNTTASTAATGAATPSTATRKVMPADDPRSAMNIAATAAAEAMPATVSTNDRVHAVYTAVAAAAASTAAATEWLVLPGATLEEQQLACMTAAVQAVHAAQLPKARPTAVAAGMLPGGLVPAAAVPAAVAVL